MDERAEEDWLMVVEDQGDVWRVLNSAFKRILPNIPTRHAVNGPTALSYLQACLVEQRLLPRMILMDLYMPKAEDGLQLLNILKEPASRLSHLPVVVMSSSTSPFDQQRVIRQNARFLAKPIILTDWNDFLATINRYWLAYTAEGKS